MHATVVSGLVWCAAEDNQNTQIHSTQIQFRTDMSFFEKDGDKLSKY
jgi:hypothetical protein